MAETTKPATMREHWQAAQRYLQMITAPGAYETWLEPLRPQGYANGVLMVAAPDALVRERVAGRLDAAVRHALWMQTGRQIAVEYVLATETGGAPC